MMPSLWIFVTSLFFSSALAIEDGMVHLYTTNDKELHIQVDHTDHFKIYLSNPPRGLKGIVNFTSDEPSIAVVQNNVNISSAINKSSPLPIRIHGKGIGKAEITVAGNVTVLNNSDITIDGSNIHVKLRVVHNVPLVTINAVIGWIYFAAWSISFYPQVFLNWKRKSVVGLNFDFVAYNLLGFVAYGLFNIGMFWIPLVQDEYRDQHPGGINPVQPNDVFFTIHAVVLTIVVIIQICIYERGDQKVSKVCMVIVAGCVVFSVIALIVTCFHKITWLTYLYYFSYIKIGVTLIKYMPQAYMNYKRKSTMGWSIGNVLLDFTGGSFSILQMFLLAYNNDDWKSIFGDLTKFGLGAISIVFDILFITQHYVLYRTRKDGYSEIDGREETYFNDASLPRPVEYSYDPTKGKSSINDKPLKV